MGKVLKMHRHAAVQYVCLNTLSPIHVTDPFPYFPWIFALARGLWQDSGHGE